jgi:hypothetical protein
MLATIVFTFMTTLGILMGIGQLQQKLKKRRGENYRRNSYEKVKARYEKRYSSRRIYKRT